MFIFNSIARFFTGNVMHDHLMPTYKPLDICLSRGEGIYAWDTEGKQYLDALCGISVTSLGHNHPAVTHAINEQASRILHTSNLYHIDNQARLADLLCEASGMDQVFFSNSGAEANEAAIKLARKYGHIRNIERPEIVVMESSFHGRTMATLTATGNRKVQAGFEPLVSGFVRAPYNDLEAIHNIAANNKNVVAILVEPVQGEGGINIPGPGYLRTLREICDANDWLLMLDEIQTGLARSGKMFAFQHDAIVPDVMTLAKALGNGIPIGACLAHGKACNVFQPGNHGSTFGGNPFACHVAHRVVSTMLEQNLAANAAARGHQIAQLVINHFAGNDAIVEVRNMGLLIGISLNRPCAELVTIALSKGLLINVTADNVVRLLPPLIIDPAQAQELVSRLIEAIEEFLQD
jgi:acetylornithine/N-succinyldiaminopimelate aminotransferase